MFWKKSKDEAPPADTDMAVLHSGEDALVDMDPQSRLLEIKKSPEERRFIMKLDLMLLSYGCLSQVIKYLVSWT
jgi:hypothetical protein